MGLFFSGSATQSKKSLDITSPAAGAISLTAGDAGVFIGNNIQTKRVTALKRIEQCIDAAREAGHPLAAAANTTHCDKDGAKLSVVLVSGASPPALTEDDVAVIWSDTFLTGAQAKSFLYDLHFESCRELLRETLSDK